MIELRTKILTGLFYQYLQRLSTQAIQLFISIILARLLLPKDFGIVALIGVFISVSNVIIDSGFSNALIQKKEVDQKDYSTVFFLNLFLSILLYLLLFFTAPFIASFYQEPSLTPIIRIIAISIIFSGLSIIQTSVLTRDLAFKKSFKVNIISVLVSGAIGIVMAIKGYGIWSLVLYQLSAQMITVLGFWLVVGWRPAFIFDRGRISSLFNYGSKIFAGSVVGVVYNNVYNLVIGKQYNTSLLGFYNRGMLIPTLIVDTAANSLNGVMFPALSSIQDDIQKVKRIVKKMLKTSTFIIFLILAILAAQAKPLIVILLTDKWLLSVPFLQIVCLTVSFYPIYLINISVLTSQGRSDLYLKATLWAKLISLVFIVACIPLGVYIMVFAGAAGSFLSALFASKWSKNLIDYSIKEQFMDLLPSLVLSIISGLLVWLFSLLGLNYWMTLIFGSLLGLTVFFLLSLLINLETPKYLLEELKTFMANKE